MTNKLYIKYKKDCKELFVVINKLLITYIKIKNQT